MQKAESRNTAATPEQELGSYQSNWANRNRNRWAGQSTRQRRWCGFLVQSEDSSPRRSRSRSCASSSCRNSERKRSNGAQCRLKVLRGSFFSHAAQFSSLSVWCEYSPRLAGPCVQISFSRLPARAPELEFDPLLDDLTRRHKCKSFFSCGPWCKLWLI